LAATSLGLAVAGLTLLERRARTRAGPPAIAEAAEAKTSAVDSSAPPASGDVPAPSSVAPATPPTAAATARRPHLLTPGSHPAPAMGIDAGCRVEQFTGPDGLLRFRCAR